MDTTLSDGESIRRTLVAARDAYHDCLASLASEVLGGTVAPDDLPYDDALAIIARWGVIPGRTFGQLGAIWTHLYVLLRSDSVTAAQAQGARDNVTLILPWLEGMAAVLRQSRTAEAPA